MTQFLTLLKLEFLLNRNRTDRRANLFSRIIKILILCVGVALIGGLVLFAFYSVINTCLKANIGNEFLVFFIFLVQLAQIIFGLTITTKTLFFNQDKDLLKLPVKGSVILLSKITYLFLKQLALTFVISAPIFIEFGVLTGQGWLFYFMIPWVCLLLPIAPFLLSIVLSVPIMYIIGYLKNKFVVMLGIYIAFVVLGFILYITCLRFILTVLQSEDASAMFSGSLVMQIRGVANNLYISSLLKNLLLKHRVVKSLIIVLSLIIIFGFTILFFANKIYLKILLKSIENTDSFYTKKTKVKQMTTTRALYFKEFLNIFRSINYSFQYLTMVICTPLMVYFSNSVASNIGIDSIGKGIIPGISVLILIMFLTTGTSFAATSLTREGGNFFHTKIIPVPYKKQVFVKFMMYVIVSAPSVFVSCLVLSLTGFLSLLDGFLIGLAVLFVIVGNIASAINIDIKHPLFMLLDGKEVTKTNKNINSSISQGYLIGIAMGIGSIVVSLFVNVPSLYLVLFGFSVPYIVFEVLALFNKIEEKYRRIEA